MYVLIKDSKAHEIIPDFNPDFPGIPIMQRYAPDFLRDCVYMPDTANIQSGMEYNKETGEFIDSKA